MPIVTWDGSLAVGHEMIDQHHEHLVELLNKTYDEFCDRKDQEVLQAVLDELIDYATYHFSQEELLMEKTGFPDTPEHLKEHAYFIRRVKEIQKDFVTGASHLSLEIISFLKNWLVNHIAQRDTVLGAYATTHQEKPVVIVLD
ncbi:bacteriohemerythrin [Geomonas subterranea]|uniref:Bacteriohemerythrin n=1 Tax=Geomonas subterranea TaxID=2847989 RepID=A0ABX8LGR7_9BACT|nr:MULTISPECIES: bacteriohemerythrin [Geomonas]QXE90106.1 bacteriohemerythrin [Geomonas subterranea]QXM07770.1 bacteriohemerythrin [Geomonas subterranea]